jgi:hypothetical protein
MIKPMARKLVLYRWRLLVLSFSILVLVGCGQKTETELPATAIPSQSPTQAATQPLSLATAIPPVDPAQTPESSASTSPTQSPTETPAPQDTVAVPETPTHKIPLPFRRPRQLQIPAQLFSHPQLGLYLSCSLRPTTSKPKSERCECRDRLNRVRGW